VSQQKPLIVGLGGSGSATGTTERILQLALHAAERAGAETLFFDGKALDMPMYSWGGERTEKATSLIEALRRADGVIIASPGYHGTVSGLIKNALDYVEDMAKDERIYFEGRAVGLIAVAAGWQATGSTLATLRSITHALRGWPTPMAIAVNSANPVFASDGSIGDAALNTQLSILAGQVVEFARMKSLDVLSRVAHGAAQGD
jgi:FMN reductase